MNSLTPPKIRLFISCLTSVIVVVTALFIFEYVLQDKTRRENIKNVTEELIEYRAKLEYLINSNLELTQGIAAYISLNPELTQQEYTRFAEQLLQVEHQVRNIGAAKNLVISHMYPLAGNEKAIGLDYRKTASQKDAALKAIKINKIIVAGPLELVQGGTGIIARKPVRIEENGSLWGLVSIVLDYDAIILASGIHSQQNLNIALRGKDAKGAQGAVFSGSADIFNTSPVQLTINLPWGNWIITAEPKNGWVNYQLHYPVWIIAVILLGIWVLVLFQRHQTQILYNQSVQNLIDSEAKFRSIFHDHNAVMLLIEKESGQIVDANEAALKYYGYSHQQLTNKTIQQINQLSRAEVHRKREKAAANHENFFIFPHQLADGTVRQVEVHSSPVIVNQKTLLFSVIHDVTQRIENEQKLKLDAKVFEHSQEGVLVTDANRKVISVNKAFSEITGYSEAEVVGKNPMFLSANKNRPELSKSVNESILQQGFWKGEVWSRKKDGTIFPELLSISKLEEHPNKISHYVAVFSDITKIKQSEARLEKLAHYDALTGLPNRLLLKSRIDHAVKQARRHDTHKLGLLFLDLDQFKMVNDSLGHMVGDELLKQVASRLRSRIREEDTISRLGGDEFVVLIEDITQVEDLVCIAQDIIEQINLPFFLQDKEAFVGTSIGIAIYPDDTQETDKLLTYADAAMYKAKQNGRNGYAFYTDAITKVADRKLQITNQLKKAIQNNELELYFQPQVSIHNNQIIGAEALIRWHHPQEGLLTPQAFIQISEESGVIHELSKWVLEQGCKQLKKWQDKNLKIGLSLNVSSKDFNYPDFICDIQALIETQQLDARYLELELTETAIMEKPKQALFTLKQIRNLGVSVSIDDFGIGHSSMAYLKQFPVNKLKIDRSFIRDLTTDNSDKTIVSTIINMAKGFELKVVAEGVESEAQQHMLLSLGCEVAQGYLYSRPLKVKEFENLLKQNLQNANRLFKQS